MNLSACWSEICPVDIAPLVQWLATANLTWPDKGPNKPSRIFDPPFLFRSVIDGLLTHFGDDVKDKEPMLSLMRAGQSHGMHVDSQFGGWVTRVHVPLVTNPGAWVAFEEDAHQWHPVQGSGLLAEVLNTVHFAAGRAYTFDATRRHSFGNAGPEDRVHLIFDVVGK